MSDQPQILVVDDEEPIRKLLKARFEREGLTVFTAENVNQALTTLAEKSQIAVVVTDVKMPGGRDGLDLTKNIKSRERPPKVIVMTGHGEKSTAIEALKCGASDYLEKPFDTEEMTHSVKRTLNEFRLERENEDFMQRLEARVARVEGKVEDQVWFVSRSKAMEPVNEWIKVLQREALRGEAEEPATLIIGESGTGKEGIARMIHAGSRRAKGPWIAVNCANFSEQLLESELFGHEKGSFTGATQQKRGLFELAKNGTLFLDELGEMDVKLQSRLLRVIQEKTFRRVGGTVDVTTDVRIVAATNQDLQKYIETGKFRDDLYHRISRVIIELPPLRFRSEDLLPMARQFFENAFHHRGKKFEGMTPATEEVLQNYSWPGNVRELLNVIERTALLWNEKGPVDAKHIILPSALAKNNVNTASGNAASVSIASTSSGAAPTATYRSPPLASTFTDAGIPNGDTAHQQEPFMTYTSLKKKWSEAFEKEYLVSILGRYQGNVTSAAKEAGIDRSNFLRLLRRHQINAQNYRQGTPAGANTKTERKAA